jgi:hypothetical protein
VSAYSPLTDGTGCGTQHYCRAGTCILGCNVAGVGVYADGARPASNDCVSCQTAVSSTQFTPVTNGSRCDIPPGHVCYNSSCNVGCVIAGQFRNGGDSNGTNTCQTCAPIISITSWTNSDNGTDCSVGGGHVCYSSDAGAPSTCQNGCFISGTYYASGAFNPTNNCQTCTPSTSATGWSNRNNGTVCGQSSTCQGGTCQ